MSTAAWRAAHREEIAAHNAAYYAAHREEIAAYNAAYHAAHREEIAAKKAAYRAAHREEIAAYQAARYDAIMSDPRRRGLHQLKGRRQKALARMAARNERQEIEGGIEFPNALFKELWEKEVGTCEVT
jgi:hypothetical protein